MLRGGLSHIVSSEYIVLDCLKHVRFHQRHVLVGCGMIDHQRPVEAKYVVQSTAILDASDLGVEWNSRECLTHFSIDLKQRRFSDVEPNYTGWVKVCDLAAKLGTNRSRCASDKYHFAFECTTDLTL